MTLRSRGARFAEFVTAELERCGKEVLRVGPARWTFELRNGTTIPARAELADRWLTLATIPELAPVPELPWRLLEWNGSLPAGCRFVLDAGGRPELRADVASDEVAGGGTALLEACGVLRETGEALVRRGASPLAKAGDDEHPLGPRWIPILEEAGWSPRDTSACAVSLDFEARGRTHRVRVTGVPGGARVAAEIARGGPIGGLAREALATLLLRASATLPRVRAAGRSDERGDAARFEVLLRAEASDVTADLAVGGVVLAAQQFGREARALVHEPLASQYQEITSPGRGRCVSTQEPALTCSK